MRTFVLFTTLFLFSLSSFCQQPFTLKISVPATFPLNRLSVSYNDGITSKELRKEDVKREMLITGKLHSLYGSVNLVMEEDSASKHSFEMFFFGAGNSAIQVPGGNVFTNAQLTNVFNAKENGKDMMDAYCRKEFNTAMDFMRANESQFGPNRALFVEAAKKFDTVYMKKLSFINANTSLFYSFRLYHQLFPELQRILPLDTLMTTFRQFPDSYKNTDEGQYLLDLILKQDTIKNMLIAADFNVLDINRNTVSLKQLKGKYAILDFWATWCGPCMEKMPALVRISSQYPEDKLAFVSISKDSDTLKYTKARERLPATWKYIYGNNENIISKIYGVTGIPVIYLIDPEGKIIFKCKGGAPEEYTKLEKILEERLTKAS